MARQCTFTIRCSLAWWLRPAISLMTAWAIITRRVPRDALIERLARRAVRTELVEKREV